MNAAQYYTAPSQEVFDEIKQAAISIWQTYDDTYGYATEKIDSIKNLENVHDNAWYMVAMFDYNNREVLLSMVSESTAEMITDAINS